MNEQQLENTIQEHGLVAPRVSPNDVDAAIASTVYGFSPSGKKYVCEITLQNGFVVTGESAVVSRANFVESIGQQVSYSRARAQIWPYLAFLMHQRQWEATQAPAPADDVAPTDFAKRVEKLGAAAGALVIDLAKHLDAQVLATKGDATPEGQMTATRIMYAEPARWLSVARTDLQKGITFLRRAIQQPTEF